MEGQPHGAAWTAVFPADKSGANAGWHDGAPGASAHGGHQKSFGYLL